MQRAFLHFPELRHVKEARPKIAQNSCLPQRKSATHCVSEGKAPATISSFALRMQDLEVLQLRLCTPRHTLPPHLLLSAAVNRLVSSRHHHHLPIRLFWRVSLHMFRPEPGVPHLVFLHRFTKPPKDLSTVHLRRVFERILFMLLVWLIETSPRPEFLTTDSYYHGWDLGVWLPISEFEKAKLSHLRSLIRHPRYRSSYIKNFLTRHPHLDSVEVLKAVRKGPNMSSA